MTDWNGNDPVGTVARWLDEAVEYAEAQRLLKRRRQEANLAKYRQGGTCPIGHPFLVYVGPTDPDRTDQRGYACSYCEFARHGFDAAHMAGSTPTPTGQEAPPE